ncbi:MAG: endonuclease/exonuclease/phosphatase family protein [Lentimicrobiaceae bacterium]
MATTNRKPDKNTKGKMSLATKIMVVVNLCFVCLLLLSYLSLYVSPAKFWLLAFAGFAYPVFLLFNLFFILFWLVFLKKYFLLSLFAILLGYNQIKTYVQFTGSDNRLTSENSIKVMSYNVRLFDLYNWRNLSSKTTRTAIFDFFLSESPDILCLQEYYSGAGKNADFADSISQKAGYKYRFIELINKDHAGLPYGLAIFSKYPIISTEKLEFLNSKVNFCQSCDINTGKDTLRILNLHLESIRFGKEDYNFVSEITNTPSSNDKLKKGSKAIFSKMKSAYIKRASQIEAVAEFIRKSPYPVIFCGDFNDTPVSYSYRQTINELDDAFVDAGNGLGQTYNHTFPLLRIDYIFHSESLQTIDFKTIENDYSDHFPLITRFKLPD